MVEPVARIRALQPTDDRLAKFIIAKANMEGIASANVKTLRHPVTLTIWIGLSCLFVHLMQWWPSQSGTSDQWYRYAAPVPAFMALAAPILALSDWLNRPYFESQTQAVLRRPDIADLCAYYDSPTRPGSGFWLLEYGTTFVGLIAVETVEDEAVVSHFFVDEPFRTAHAQNDLLSYALKYAFESSKGINTVKVDHNPLRAYICQALDAMAFRPIKEQQARVGVYRWKVGVRKLERKVWEKIASST